MLKVGILGRDRIGEVHARSIRALDTARIVAVADAVGGAADALAAKTGAEVRSADEIIGSADIDAVVICTPTDTHFDLIQASAQAGRRNRHDPVARPVSAVGLLHPKLRRHLPGHDDPRLRHGAFSARR